MDKLLLTVSDLQGSLSLGRTKIYELIASGEIGPILRVGRSVRIPYKVIEDWVAKQTAQTANPGNGEG